MTYVQDDVLANSLSAVTSMSLSGSFYSPINDQVNTMVNTHKISVTCAAGNSGDNACNYSPGSATAALTVAASDTQDARADFSSYGSCCKIAAPGVNIVAAVFNGDNTYGTKSGTSMSTPLVAGLCALDMEQQLIDNPGLTRADGALAHAHVVAMATALKINTPSGRLPLAFSSVGLPPVAQPPPPPPPPAPPQPNKAGPNMPLGLPATSDATINALARFLGHPLVILLLFYWLC